MLRVLVIVDGQNTSNEVGLLLESAEVESYQATDLISAIRHLETQELNYQELDCVILDATIRPEQIFELTQGLHLYSSAPIIAISQNLSLIQREQWEHAGIWEVLPEFRLSEIGLVRVLQWAVRVYQAERQAKLAQQRLKRNDRLLVRHRQTIEQQQQRIHQLNGQLTDATQVKQQFLSIVSHELRTPMNAIIGFSQLLLRRGQETYQINWAERILVNAQHLMNLIEEILEFSRIEAGNLKLHPCCIDLSHLLHALVQELADTADHQNLQLFVDLELDNPFIVVDPGHLQQALFKLLTNAIKFTTTGSVTVKVREVEGDRLAIFIQDTGMGIQPTELEHIFEPFRQGDQSITRLHRGMGLGLTVTAALIRQMQGSISVCSTVGQGSEFRIELPRQLEKSPSLNLQAMPAH